MIYLPAWWGYIPLEKENLQIQTYTLVMLDAIKLADSYIKLGHIDMSGTIDMSSNGGEVFNVEIQHSSLWLSKLQSEAVY